MAAARGFGEEGEAAAPAICHAANVIAHYPRVSPTESDAVLAKLAGAKRGGT